MKICFIAGAFPEMKCGVGDYCSKLANELSNSENIEIYVITSTKANANVKGIKIFNIIEKWDKTATKRIIKALKEIKPDIINIEYPSNEYEDVYYIFNILPLIIKMKIKCKLTETLHEFDMETLSKKRKIRYWLNFVLMSQVIVVEQIFKEFIKRHFSKAKVKYIPISSNIPRVEINESEKEKIRKDLGINNQKVISYFGFINEKKGIENLLNAISKLDNVILLIIGELNKEDEYQHKIIQLIEKLKIQNKVKITGFIKDERIVAKYLNATDLCVLPFKDGVQSRNGSFLAAYNQSIPIITTNKAYTKDENGIYYVECNNEEVLIQKIKEVLKINKKAIREELNWKNVAEEYIKILEDM